MKFRFTALEGEIMKREMLFWSIVLALIGANLYLFHRVSVLDEGQMNIYRGISDYNYIAGGLKMPQIGQTPDGGTTPGARAIDSDEYLKDRVSVLSIDSEYARKGEEQTLQPEQFYVKPHFDMMPQIGQTPDGGTTPVARAIDSDEYLKERRR